MDNNITSNKRIAKNTILLYARMLLILIVSLYTSRIVLSALGVVDFGIYNVVAGVVTMFSFINTSMATSTQRYLTYNIGKGNINETKTIFANSIRVHLIIGAIIFILCECFGVWIINNTLSIPPERVIAANWVFQIALIQFLINISQVPYNACIIAHEKMGAFAYISIIEAILKLLIVFGLSVSKYDKLITYTVLLLVVTLIIRFCYVCYCKKSFEECHVSINSTNGEIKEMFTFAGWNVFGSIAWMLRDQGVNILLNIFFGPIVNAARGIAFQASGAVNSFVTNFTMAVNPQITKNYAREKYDDMETLAYRGSRYSFLLLFLIGLPLMINIDYVLNIWLKEVPHNASVFLILIMIDSLVNSVFGQPLITSLQATGKIKKYQIFVSFCIIAIIPISCILFSLGAEPYSIFIVIIISTLISGIVRFSFCSKQIGYKWKTFSRDVVLRVIIVILIALPSTIACDAIFSFDDDFNRFLFSSFTAASSVVFAALLFGITPSERKDIIEFVRLKIKK